jgi:ornithine cyclodeaminase/alanine dehydrogenase-like protein (mu-crystallin family)
LKIISRDAVVAAMSPRIMIEAMRDAFLALHRHEVVAPNEFHMRHPVSGDIHIKGAHLFGSPWMVAKVASAGFATPGNHGCLLGIRSDSGAIEYFVDDQGLLTELRTAAAVALSVELLSRADASSLAIIGAGVQAQYQLNAVKTVRTFSDIRVASRRSSSAVSFAQLHNIRACTTVDEALEGADVVLLATTSQTPIITRISQLGVGSHVTASGADMVGKVELSTSVLQDADLLVVDSIELAARVGMLQHSQTVSAYTIGEQLSDHSVGRTNDNQRTICGLVGLGVQDAAAFSALLKHLP